jgi:hypothetical protein
MRDQLAEGARTGEDGISGWLYLPGKVNLGAAAKRLG